MLQWAKEKSETPSNFTLKLRKHLRTRRLEDIRQLGVDRIVDFTFGEYAAAWVSDCSLLLSVTKGRRCSSVLPQQQELALI